VSDTPLHPTPQFARPGWVDLCGKWDFAHDDNDEGLNAGWPRRADVFGHTITVPFPPESAASGIHEPGHHPVVWYRRTVPLVRPDAGTRTMLHFGAVDYRAAVWVNGQLVATHEGGHTPFSVDITNELAEGSEQVIVVRAEDQPLDMGMPRGKQDWLLEPHVIWYHRTTGIWQPVWIEAVSTLHVASLRWTPDLHRAALGLAVRLNRMPAQPVTLRVRLTLHDVVLVDDLCTVHHQDFERELVLPMNELAMAPQDAIWWPERPNLIDAELTLLAGDTVLDTVQSYAGMRSVGMQDGRFLLNGRPYYLRSVLEQGYWPESHLAAPSPEALKREVELIKALGFNSVRIHQKVEDPRFLYWCDRLGLTVWGEMANSYIFTWESAERIVREWMEVLQRDYSHPCIVTWVPINESWGVPNLPQDGRQRELLRALYALTKTFDPTRPVVDNDGWEHTRTDILSIHDYTRQGATILERYGTDAALSQIVATGRPLHHVPLLAEHEITPGAPVMLTEFGGISYAPRPGEKWYGYGTVNTAHEYIDKLRELFSAVAACPGIAGFCYTQLTDTEQETNGLLTEDREPKFDIEVIREIVMVTL
jgi:beta-galactosidase/beta-glucuronidase